MITFKELLERAESELIAIHTATEDQSITLLTELDEKGYEWTLGVKLTTQTNYDLEEENTCYSFRDRYGKLLNKVIMYGRLNSYKGDGYTIIEFKDILLK